MSNRKLTVKIIGDSSNVERMFGRVGSAGQGMGSRLGSVAAGGTRLLAGVAVGVGALGAATTAAAFNLSGFASDLGEARSKSEKVFADMSGDMSAFAQTAYSSVGMSERAALDMSASFGVLWEATGAGKSEMAQFSQDWTHLVADFASFDNLSTEEAFTKLLGSLGGEMDGLKGFIAPITAAEVEAHALAMGLGDVNDKVSEGAKIQARAELVMERLSARSGDFADTADGQANAARSAGAAWENFKARLGENLSPVFATMLSTATRMLANFGAKIGPLADQFAEFFGPVMLGAQRVVSAFTYGLFYGSDGEPADGSFFGRIQTFGLVIREKFLPAIGSAIGWVRSKWPEIQAVFGSVLDGVAAAVTFVATEVIPRVITAGKLVVGWITDNWPEIAATTKAVFERVRDIIGAVVDVVLAFWDRFGSTIISVITVAWDLVREVVGRGTAIVLDIFTAFSQLFEGDWSGLWDSIKSILSGALGLVVEIVKGAFSLVWTTITGVLSNIFGDVGGALDGVGGLFRSFGSAIAGAASATWDTVKSVFQTGVDAIAAALGAFTSLFEGGWSGMWDRVKTKLSEVVGSAWEIAKGGFDRIRTTLASIMSTIKGGVSRALDDVVGFFVTVPGRLWGVFTGAGSWLWSAGLDIVQGLWDGLASRFASMTSWLADKVAATLAMLGPLGAAVTGAMDLAGTAAGLVPSSGSSEASTSRSRPASTVAGYGTNTTTVNITATSTAGVNRAVQAGASGGYGFGGVAPGATGGGYQ